MSLPRGTKPLGVHHDLSLAKLNCQTTHTRPMRLPRDIILSPFFPHSLHPAAQQQEPGNYPTPAIRPHEEDDGQLRTENLASKSMEPASGWICFPFCIFSLIVSLLSWLLGNWENPLNACHSLIQGPTLLWKPWPGALLHLPVFQETSKSERLSVLLTPIRLDNKQRHPG